MNLLEFKSKKILEKDKELIVLGHGPAQDYSL
jgi:hypothetical protein